MQMLLLLLQLHCAKREFLNLRVPSKVFIAVSAQTHSWQAVAHLAIRSRLIQMTQFDTHETRPCTLDVSPFSCTLAAFHVSVHELHDISSSSAARKLFASHSCITLPNPSNQPITLIIIGNDRIAYTMSMHIETLTPPMLCVIPCVDGPPRAADVVVAAVDDASVACDDDDDTADICDRFMAELLLLA